MKTGNNRVFGNTEPLTFTSLAPKTFSAGCRSLLENLKNSLVQRFTAEFSDLEEKLVKRAVEDANALASLTSVPHLLLPMLAEEKVLSARQWSAQQRTILQRSHLSFAA